MPRMFVRTRAASAVFAGAVALGLSMEGRPVDSARKGLVPVWSVSVPEGTHALDSWAHGYAAGDLDEDGIDDVAFGTRDGYAIAVDGRSGVESWRTPLSDADRSPAAPVATHVVDADMDGTLEVVAVADGRDSDPGGAVIALLEGRNGQRRWQTYVGGTAVADLAYGRATTGTLTVTSTVVFAAVNDGSGNGRIVVLDARSGAVVTGRGGFGRITAIDAGDVDGDGSAEVAVEDGARVTVLAPLAGPAGLVVIDVDESRAPSLGGDVAIASVRFPDPLRREVLSGRGPVTCRDHGALIWESEGFADHISAGNIVSDAGYVMARTEVVYSDHSSRWLYLLDGNSGALHWMLYGPFDHALGDLDGDGLDDIVAAQRPASPAPEGWFELLALDGAGDLLWGIALPDPDPIRVKLATARLDQDRRKEILVLGAHRLTAFDPR